MARVAASAPMVLCASMVARSKPWRRGGSCRAWKWPVRTWRRMRKGRNPQARIQGWAAEARATKTPITMLPPARRTRMPAPSTNAARNDLNPTACMSTAMERLFTAKNVTTPAMAAATRKLEGTGAGPPTSWSTRAPRPAAGTSWPQLNRALGQARLRTMWETATAMANTTSTPMGGSRMAATTKAASSGCTASDSLPRCMISGKSQLTRTSTVKNITGTTGPTPLSRAGVTNSAATAAAPATTTPAISAHTPPGRRDSAGPASVAGPADAAAVSGLSVSDISCLAPIGHRAAGLKEQTGDAEEGAQLQVAPDQVDPAHCEPAHCDPAHCEPAHCDPAHCEPAHCEP